MITTINQFRKLNENIANLKPLKPIKQKFLLYANPNNSTNRAYVAIGGDNVSQVLKSARQYPGSYTILHKDMGTNDDLQKAKNMFSNYNFGDTSF